MTKRQKILLTLTILIIILLSITLTYAFFTIDISQKKVEISIKSGDMIITFDDVGEVSHKGNIEAGDKITKQFVIENSGSLGTGVSIYWDELINTYITESLSYKLYESFNENGNYHEIQTPSVNIPHCENSSKVLLSSSITIPAKQKRYYKLEITYEHLPNIDQNNDFNASLSTKFTIDQAMMSTVDQIISLVDINSLIFNDIYPEYTNEYASFITVNYNNTSTSTVFTNEKYYVFASEYEEDLINGYFILKNAQAGTKDDILSAFQNNTNIYVNLDTPFSTLAEAQNSITTTDLNVILKMSETNITTKKISIDALAYNIDQTKVYALEDDYGMSYYFRGDVKNNYVKFGKNSTGQDMWWRIIRINGDKTIRMIYDGTRAYDNNETDWDRVAVKSITWNDKYDDVRYLGYMYGNESVSKISAQTNEVLSNPKIQLEDWYEKNIFDTGYHDYLSDEIFCNDRSTASKIKEWYSSDTTLGYGINKTFYGSYNRIVNTKEPSFKCSSNDTININNDKFTVSPTKGNGQLKYPVGLITADEVMAAGGNFGSPNIGYYLNKGIWYWTMSPYGYTGNAQMFRVQNNGELNYYRTINKGGLAPVINLSKESVLLLKGKGTMDDPYTIE